MGSKSHTAIDLFSGAGGLSLGLRWAGFEVRAAVDNDSAAVDTYRKNLGKHILKSSIEKCSAAKLLKQARLEEGECTLLAGGPPCQGFSVQRRGSDSDERNNLVRAFLARVLSIKPRFFLMENVPGLMSKRGRVFFEYVRQSAEKANYRCHVAKLNAADFEVPQIRQRVFLVGERRDGGKTYFRFPSPALQPETWKTVRQAIGDLPSPPEDGSPHHLLHNHYREARLSKTNLERIACVPEGGGREHLPVRLQLPCHVNNQDHRHLDVYGRLAWKKPSVTLTARFDSFTRGRFGHPVENRSITLREGARIQSFPDDFEFLGNREEVARQIGNAVPPLLGKHLGIAIIDALVQRSENHPSLEQSEHHQVLLFELPS